MEQLQQSLVPVINNWRTVLAEQLSCIETGRCTPGQQKAYRSRRAFLDCMQAYLHGGSAGEALVSFLDTSGDIGLTKHMLQRSSEHIPAEDRALCVGALNRAISARMQKEKTYVCKRCVLVFQSREKPGSCVRCGSSGLASARPR